MPNNILITPGSASIQFSGSAANTIRLQVEASGSIAFYGNSGSLFGISDSLSGSLMSVNDISGLPILEVFSDDRVVMGSFNKNTLVVTGSRVGIFKTAPTATLDVSGSVFVTGSLNVTAGITGSLLGTSSWASNAISSSFATTSSFASIAQTLLGSVVSASYAATASLLLGSIESASFATTASYATTAQNVLGSITSASYAATASLLLGSVESASFATTASAATSITFTPATASFAISASWAPYGGLVTKVGSIANTSFTGNPRKAPVNFTASFANTSYAIVITGEDSRAWSIEGKVVGGFTASANSNTALAGTTYWVATAYGEI